jgi:hypothetical protein
LGSNKTGRDESFKSAKELRVGSGELRFISSIKAGCFCDEHDIISTLNA